MITYSGVHIQTIGGADGTPTAEDIAVHAGRLCRFGGAVWYPLLPHLVLVGLLAYRRSGNPVDMLWGFLHDAHEVVTSDVPRPFKCDCMRREQTALDDRIIERFIGGNGLPDFHLIKQCDLDACDLEAVELGLPGYQEIALTNALSYRRQRIQKVWGDAAEAGILRRILQSDFYHNTISAASVGVLQFRAALTDAECGCLDVTLRRVESWGLLEA